MKISKTGIASIALAFGLVSHASMAEANVVEMYSSLTTDTQTQLIDAFHAANPHIRINWVRGGGIGIFQRLVTERMAGAGNIDLFHTSYAPGWYYIANEGWVAPGATEVAEVQHYPDWAMSEDAHYVALRVSTLHVVYNTNNVSPDEVPTSWHDLTTDRWRDRVVLPDPHESAGVWDFFYGAEGFGPEYIEGLFSTRPRIGGGMGLAIDAVARGERDVSFIFEYIIQDRIDQGAPIAVAPMEEGTPAQPGPLGLIAGGSNPEAAKEVISWILSEAGQKVVVEGVGTYSAHANLGPPPGDWTPLNEMKLIHGDFQKVFREHDQYRDLIERLRRR